MGRSKQNRTQVAEAEPQSHPAAGATSQSTSKQSFETLYLQQMSKEFADDLEKLRTANDFKGEKSVQILVEALKQGSACFSQDDLQHAARE